MDPDHLPLGLRKALCGRLRVFHATAPHEEGAALNGHRSAFDALRTKLADYAASSADTSPSDVPLDRFVRDMVPRIDVELAASAANPRVAEQLAVIADEIRRQWNAINCRDCVAGTGPICTGYQSTDNRIVARRGACLRPLNDLFEFIRRDVLTWYQQHAPLPAERLEATSVRLSTRLLERPLNQLSVCTQINAGAFYRDDGEQRITDIVLMIEPHLLDAASFLSVPYLLFHELVCHAWQGCGIVSSRSRNEISYTKPNDYFAEGWMDWIAFRLFERAAQSCSAATLPLLGIWHRKPGLLVHETRTDRMVLEQMRAAGTITEKAYNELAVLRSRLGTGIHAAEQFERFLRNHEEQICAGGACRDAEEAFFRVSAALNLQPGIVSRRMTFVTRTLELLCGRSIGPQAQARLVVAIRKFITHNDLLEFIDSIG